MTLRRPLSLRRKAALRATSRAVDTGEILVVRRNGVMSMGGPIRLIYAAGRPAVACALPLSNAPGSQPSRTFAHGMPTTQAATINADLLAFLKP